ncbi:hypothetical protein TrLO_g15849 [Triparma laevis f. longispina]|uniref:Uncharacterized protein n=1 Tax=Triparma laevis f. longispina TaxID=1714387 RepID=A0A9W7AUA0_9STRA|nr:hypothetical protein TrLO_g15849 [Triparma laevis f. longispina]
MANIAPVRASRVVNNADDAGATGGLDAMASNARSLDVDGATLQKLTPDGWKELAAPSLVTNILIAKIMAKLDKLVLATPVSSDQALLRVFVDHDPELLEADKIKECGKMTKLFAKKTFEGGAEHTRQWLPSIANGTIDGSNLKGHALRFLGMYNVVDLLTFTIGAQFLLEEKKELPMKENVFDLIICFISALSCVLSGTGMTASTITYNCASSVTEANMHAYVKSPGVNRCMMFINDVSIWGFNFLCVAMTLTVLKFGWSDNPMETTFQMVQAPLLTLPVLYLFYLGANRIVPGVGFTTHYALYAGLMGDTEVIPEGETSGWAIRWSQDEIGAFLNDVTQANMCKAHSLPWKPMGAMELDIMKKYSHGTENLRKKLDKREEDVTSILEMVSSVNGLKKKGAGKRRRSIGKVQLTPGDGAQTTLALTKTFTALLKYGFIVFQNHALQKCFISEFNGKVFDETETFSYFTLNAEPFGGEDKDGTEAKLPLKLVEFVLGKNKSSNRTYRKQKQNAGRISGDDVLRLSRGQPAKVKGKGSRGVPHRLNSEERAEFERSERRGYLRIDGTGYRRERKGSPLANVWRQHCDSINKPTIIMMKASGRAGGGRTEIGDDSVVLDWSTLRDPSNEETRRSIEENVAKAAAANNLQLKALDDDDEEVTPSNVLIDPAFKWDVDPIWKLPALNLRYEGQRPSAQAMCKALANDFDTMKRDEEGGPVTAHHIYGGRAHRGPKNRRDAGAKGGGKTKPKKFKRQRGGGKSHEDQLKNWNF